MSNVTFLKTALFNQWHAFSSSEVDFLFCMGVIGGKTTLFAGMLMGSIVWERRIDYCCCGDEKVARVTKAMLIVSMHTMGS
jgi:hypothetical protein